MDQRSDDPLLAGVDSPALERYWQARAEREELELMIRRQESGLPDVQEHALRDLIVQKIPNLQKRADAISVPDPFAGIRFRAQAEILREVLEVAADGAAGKSPAS